ncbi:MAG: fasciclin domain-containing protein, partial [Bacteroidota bacterium]|nr:fasciclin domain-containing protein [Bacteroidota bacterium]
PFTVFAPTNEAFNELPKGTVDNLLKPENKEKLQGILKYHVVAGKISSDDLKKMIKDNNGKATLKTVEGDNLYASMDKNGGIWIWDENGGKAMVTIADVNQSNGVIHVVNHVLLPKM